MTGPQYPNQQLRSVSLETYFPGRFSMFAALDRVQDRVAGELPNLFVPNVQLAEGLGLRPYQMRNAAQTESLAVALNQATFISFAYPGYTEFSGRALELLDVVYQECGIRELDRVVYRYENEISLSRVKGCVQIDRIMKLPLPEWCGAEQGLLDVNLGWHRNSAHGSLGFQLEIGPFSDGSGEALKITIWSMVRPAGGIEQLARCASVAHEEAKAYFEEMITDDFRKEISGSGEEEE